MLTNQQRDPRESKAIRIRQSDTCPSSNEPFDPEHCAVSSDVRTRLATVERELTLIKSAFVLNDLNLPDFDGHRSDHRIRKEAAKVMENYKITATHKVIAAVMAAIVLFFSSGITTRIQAIVQTKEIK